VSERDAPSTRLSGAPPPAATASPFERQPLATRPMRQRRVQLAKETVRIFIVEAPKPGLSSPEFPERYDRVTRVTRTLERMKSRAQARARSLKRLGTPASIEIEARGPASCRAAR
jgi:hypothetical protein